MSNIKRGYWGIGIYNPKTEVNIGTLWRSAFAFSADFLFTIGHRYKEQPSDTTQAWRHIPLFSYESFEDFQRCRPYNCQLIGIEIVESARPLTKFIHSERAIYLLGAEDHGLPPAILSACQHVLMIPGTKFCLNVSVAGSIVMFHRAIQRIGQ